MALDLIFSVFALQWKEHTKYFFYFLIPHKIDSLQKIILTSTDIDCKDFENSDHFSLSGLTLHTWPCSAQLAATFTDVYTI